MRVATTSRLLVEEVIDLIKQLQQVKNSIEPNYYLNRVEELLARFGHNVEKLHSVYPRPESYFMDIEENGTCDLLTFRKNAELLTYIYSRELPEQLRTDLKIINHLICQIK